MWFFFFFFKQKTAYEMRISDWSSDVCSSDLTQAGIGAVILIASAERCCHIDDPRPAHTGGTIDTQADDCLIAAASCTAHDKRLLRYGDKRRALIQRAGIGRASGRERVCQDV